jgi:hypothetical protein
MEEMINDNEKSRPIMQYVAELEGKVNEKSAEIQSLRNEMAELLIWSVTWGNKVAFVFGGVVGAAVICALILLGVMR